MTDIKLTDEQLARQEIFGEKIVVSPENQDTPDSPETPDEPEVPDAPDIPDVSDTPDTPDSPETPDEPVFNPENIKDEQFVELMNKKFNTKFDTVDAAKDYFSTQVSYRGQEDIIQKLVEKVKQSNNVLSHFPSENAYKAAQLAKTEYPKMETTLNEIMNSNVESLNDFDAIRLNERLKRGPDSRVDPLRFKLTKMGLRDLDVADFDEWDEADKEIVYGEAEDAKKSLMELQGKVQVPKEGEGEDLEFLSEIERGVQERSTNTQQVINDATPIAQSLVDNLSKINPVEGSDFEYLIELDSDSKKELTDFLIGEVVEGNYDVKSERDVATMTGLLVQEIWATDGPKIAAAYAKAAEDKVWEEADKKYENWTPLDEGQQRRSPKEKSDYNDNDAAQAIISGKRK